MTPRSLDTIRLAITGVAVIVVGACVALAVVDASALSVGAVFVVLIVVAGVSNLPRYRWADVAAAVCGSGAYGVLESSGGGGTPAWLMATICFAGVAATVRWLGRGVVQLEARQDTLRIVVDELTVHDDASGLMKRRYGELALEDEVRRARRTGDRLTLLVAAPDPIPDHSIDVRPDEEDEAAAMGTLFRDTLRVTDRLARLSSTTFAAILPATDTQGGAVVAEKLIQRARERGLRPLRLGVATFPETAVSSAELLREAQAALEFARAGDMTSATPTMLA
jgi:GGDEF domain-containing protein